jgi:hypothetical protein
MDEVVRRRSRAEIPRARGRPFTKGNPGRRRGSKNRNTLIAQTFLDGGLELLQIAYSRAKAGNGPMLKFFLERIVPKDRLVHVELPAMENASDASRVLEAIIEAVATGEVSPSEAAALGSLVESRARVMESFEIGARVDDLETRMKDIQRLLEQWSRDDDKFRTAAAHQKSREAAREK